MSNKPVGVNSQLMALAAPYEIHMVENIDTYDIRISLVDKRSTPPVGVIVKIPHEKMTGATGHLGMAGETVQVIRRAVNGAKKRLQSKLAEKCSEPELRLWAARNLDVDLLDGSPIPSRVRLKYVRHLKDEDPIRQSKVVEKNISEDTDPVETPIPPPRKKVVRKVGGLKIEATEPAGESNEVASPKIVKGAHPKTTVRKPQCPKHEGQEMEFFPEDALWKCPEEDCKITARPKGESTAGKVTLGKGQLDIRVIFPEPGGKPSVLLVSDNNVALDITEYVDMENFEKYNSPRIHARKAAVQGKRSEEVAPNRSINSDRMITALLRFKTMKVQGCENA